MNRAPLKTYELPVRPELVEGRTVINREVAGSWFDRLTMNGRFLEVPNIDFINELLKPKESIGCDFGATSLKFVRLKKKGKNSLSLETLGTFESAVLSGDAVSLDRVKNYFREHGLAGGRAAVNIETATLRIRRMDLPDMPEADTKVAIRWNFREHVDGPVEQYAVNYSVIGAEEGGGGKRPIMAYAVANKDVEDLVRLVRQAGLKAASVEPNATALLAAFDLNVGFEAGKNYVLLDLGDRIVNFLVVGGGCLLFSRPLTNMGGEFLLKSLAKNAGVNMDQARTYLRAGEAVPENASKIIQGTMSEFLSQLVVEIQRSVDAFCLMYHVDRVDAIYLAGGLSLLTGLPQYLSKNLGIDAVMFNPFGKIDVGALAKDIVSPQLYAVAVGLAMPHS